MVLIRFLLVILGVLIGASLLSGSSVAFHSWYAFPAECSNLLLIVITFQSCISVSLRVGSFFIKKSKKEKGSEN